MSYEKSSILSNDNEDNLEIPKKTPNIQIVLIQVPILFGLSIKAFFSIIIIIALFYHFPNYLNSNEKIN